MAKTRTFKKPSVSVCSGIRGAGLWADILCSVDVAGFGCSGPDTLVFSSSPNPTPTDVAGDAVIKNLTLSQIDCVRASISKIVVVANSEMMLSQKTISSQFKSRLMHVLSNMSKSSKVFFAAGLVRKKISIGPSAGRDKALSHCSSETFARARGDNHVHLALQNLSLTEEKFNKNIVLTHGFTCETPAVRSHLLCLSIRVFHEWSGNQVCSVKGGVPCVLRNLGSNFGVKPWNRLVASSSIKPQRRVATQRG